MGISPADVGTTKPHSVFCPVPQVRTLLLDGQQLSTSKALLVSSKGRLDATKIFPLIEAPMEEKNPEINEKPVPTVSPQADAPELARPALIIA